ncbi:MAG: Peptidyl-tRNA hydrolase [uncultured Thermomicrobiales bacterium]|uniref:Peptidyl-tRNA hydrolase n=1 Tax=uncultured Thermomicrobiales bacterium TaxID=1645740 RepID=A0A6J4VGU2_9BACT|nr:MAG: Peptidyl-tRNA hydrolase [uncultured Thermomicrobiales bacterium]
MRIVVGLGNPGREYAATRHNLGFMVVDELARRAGAGGTRKRFRAEIAEGFLGGEKLVLVKPQTYMNLSGHATREAVNWYHVPREHILVIVDDLDLAFGTARLRAEGSAGGHNGLTSVIEQLGSRAVPRLRVGIGRGSGVATTQVLSRFSADEERALPAVIENAADCATAWASAGIIAAMNACNRKESG